ncbi:response regulator [Cyanobacterium sp. DS4]|uniref:response regulator n=1 Tax=Cyanobacterium sp. DS4 TaxID=2878255 RepID=UPI002E8230EF|nr:response regulator [Cyanobacterium sp. Dongsha4]WVL00490.1 response regulator [Cyanobacterium sp. Dongsha4]
MRILLVDDDEILIDILEKTLQNQNYTIDAVMDGQQGWTYVSTYNYDLIILDWSLPKLDGISLCKRIRHYGYDMPIMILTARHSSQEKSYALDVGADDYLCKPFDIEELMARIRALLRRSQSYDQSSPLLNWGSLYLDPCICQVSYQGNTIQLTTKEYQLLELFLRHPHEVFSIEAIIENLWSSIEYPSEATVRSHLRYLRQKLKQAGLSENPIDTIRGRGYCLKSQPMKTEIKTEQNTLVFPSEIEKEKHLQQLTALNNIWEKYQDKREEQLNILQTTLNQIKEQKINKNQLKKAIDNCHKLSGNLGIFGFNEASYLASQLEQLLKENLEKKLDKIKQFETILNNLIWQINPQKDEKLNHLTNQIIDHCSLVLVISEDVQFKKIFNQEAVKKGIITITMTDLETVKIWFKSLEKEQFPDVVIMSIAFNQWQQELVEEYLAFITELNLQTPPIPSIIIGDRYERNFSHRTSTEERLLIAEKGGTFYLKKPVTPQEAIKFCQIALKRYAQGRKIMIIDEDEELLRLLPIYLQPWGFNITTLHDTRQFWDVLCAIAPDVLILEIEMPYLNGIEICKMLRTHTQWYQLPIIYYTKHTEPIILEKAFNSGANDIIPKTFTERTLAQRIIKNIELGVRS